MNNEDTRLINEDPKMNEEALKSVTEKNNSTGKIVASAVGGFVAGSAATIASNLVNSGLEDKDSLSEETGMPENHVSQTSESDVDPQNHIFSEEHKTQNHTSPYAYNEITDSQISKSHDAIGESQELNQSHQSENLHEIQLEVSDPFIDNEEFQDSEIAHNAEMISEDPVVNDVRVLGVEAVQIEDGSVMNVAYLESGNDHALMVDVDNDHKIEVFIHDDNTDGQIQEDEIHDISHADISVEDLIMAQAAQEGDYLAAIDDDMPDYINDVQTEMEV